MKPTLVVLAAGMGSRYGGLKQVELDEVHSIVNRGAECLGSQVEHIDVALGVGQAQLVGRGLECAVGIFGREAQ